MCRWARWNSGFAMAVVGVMTAMMSHNAWSLPAFARAYDTKCETCHSPMPPRLNNVGIAFKRFGWRMPDADDKGNLILKDKPSKSLGEDLSIHGDLILQNSNNPAPGTGETQTQLSGLEVHGGGTLLKGFSYRVDYSLHQGPGVAPEQTLLEGDAQFTSGKPEHPLTVRAGQFFPYTWEKMNIQTLSTATPFFDAMSVPIGSFSGFNRAVPQQGLSVGYSINRLKNGEFSSTMFTGAVLNGLNQAGAGNVADTNNSKDVLLEVNHLWGIANTISAFYYTGDSAITMNNLPPGPPAPYASPFTDSITRYGITGNYHFKPAKEKDLTLDVLGGYMRGQDNTDEPTVANISSKTIFGEVTVSPKDRLAGLLRFERWTADGISGVNGFTASILNQPADNVLLIAEYHRDNAAGRMIGLRLRFAY